MPEQPWGDVMGKCCVYKTVFGAGCVCAGLYLQGCVCVQGCVYAGCVQDCVHMVVCAGLCGAGLCGKELCVYLCSQHSKEGNLKAGGGS